MKKTHPLVKRAFVTPTNACHNARFHLPCFPQEPLLRPNKQAATLQFAACMYHNPKSSTMCPQS